MKTPPFSIATAIVVLLTVANGTASAQCAFEHPKKAGKLAVSLVQAFVPCGGVCFGGTIEGASCDVDADCIGGGFCRAFLNGAPVVPVAGTGSTPGLGLSTCPATTFFEGDMSLGAWHWDEASGSASLTLKPAKEKRPISPLNPAGSADWAGVLKIKGVTNVMGPADGTGSLRLSLRLTKDDGATGTTVQEIPFRTFFDLVDGKTTFKFSLNERLNALGETSLPACTSIELVSAVVESGGTPFLVPGAFLP